MLKTNLLLVFIFLFAACGPAPTGKTVSACGEYLKGMQALTGGLEIPPNFRTENFAKVGGEFNVMKYFTVLDHLSMKPGYVLDYVYHYDGMGGYPVLYPRIASQPPYATEADLSAAGKLPDYLDYVQVEDTPEGYFQFVVLATMGNRFYLFWHAGYNDRQIVCDKAGVADIVSSLNGDFGNPISPSARVQASLLKGVEPAVSVTDQTVEVQFVTFTRWGGFYLNTYTISRLAPHIIQKDQEENLVPYECGVMF
jgi:hypothetical protein